MTEKDKPTVREALARIFIIPVIESYLYDRIKKNECDCLKHGG